MLFLQFPSGGEFFMPLLELIDKDKELERLIRKRQKLEG